MASEPTLNPTAARTLWVRMAEIYGHRWTSAYGDNPNEGAALTWAKGLGGITPRQLADGLRSCIASSEPWPPTLPEFRGYCLGIPALAEIRHELHTSTPTRSLFATLVWQGIDGYAFRLASREQGDRMIRDAYEMAREHVMRGGELPGASAGEITQEKPEIKVADPEVAKAHLAEIAAMVGGKMAAAGPDA